MQIHTNTNSNEHTKNTEKYKYKYQRKLCANGKTKSASYLACSAYIIQKGACFASVPDMKIFVNIFIFENICLISIHEKL